MTTMTRTYTGRHDRGLDITIIEWTDDDGGTIQIAPLDPFGDDYGWTVARYVSAADAVLECGSGIADGLTAAKTAAEAAYDEPSPW